MLTSEISESECNMDRLSAKIFTDNGNKITIQKYINACYKHNSSFLVNKYDRKTSERLLVTIIL